MKIKKIALLMCVVALMELFSIGVFAAATEHDVSQADVILTDACGDNCLGHVITGTTHFDNKIQILSGEHDVTLKDVDILCFHPEVPFTVEAGAKADVTIEGTVSFNGEVGIMSHGELNLYGDETSRFYASGHYEGIYVTDDFSVKGGYILFGTGGYPGEVGDAAKNHIIALLAEGDGVTVTFEDADVRAVNNGYDETQPYFRENTEYDHIATCGIKAPNLVVKNSKVGTDTGNVFYEEGLTPKAIGVDVENLLVSDSEMNVNAGKCYISYGIRCSGTATFENTEVTAEGTESTRQSVGMVGGSLVADNSEVNLLGGVVTDTEDGALSQGISVETLRGTDSEIRGEGGKATVSNGISASDISIEGGVVYGIGSEEGEGGYGIRLIGSSNQFELVGGDAVARGETQGLLADADDFAGVSFKADENDEAQVKTDLGGKEFHFGNPYKVSYLAGNVEAEKLPADAIYYREQRFTLPKEVPTAEGFLFLGWEDINGTFYEAEQDHEVFMNAEDTFYIAVWECLRGNNCILNRFDDLNINAWYHDGVEFCYENGRMQGMSRTTFEPETAATRGMIVTTLYRMDGEPGVDTQNEFTDVPADAWYTDAVNWAVECGIAYGYEDGSFRPDQPATREEMAVFLYRMAEYYGVDVTGSELPDWFADKDDVSGWAVPALEWAVVQNIINGLDNETLEPRGNATRAQLATVLYRFELSLIGEA